MTDPRWLALARTLLGTREVPGAKNSPIIMSWAQRLGVAILGIVYAGDAVPWCGLFMAHCFRSVGIAPPAIAVRAKSWASWGIGLPPAALMPGAVLVFERTGGGHVALYLGEDATHYHCLGGNQGDAVTIARIDKSRCVARRWPKGEKLVGGPMRLTAAGAPVSRSQA